MFLNDLPTIPAPEPGLNNWLVAFADLNKLIQVGLAPTITENTVEAKRVILAVKFFNCPHTNHWQSITISIQAIQAKETPPKQGLSSLHVNRQAASVSLLWRDQLNPVIHNAGLAAVFTVVRAETLGIDDLFA